MMKKISALTITGLLIIGNVNAADQEELFVSLDTDQNGSISVQEAKADKTLLTAFKLIDKDQNKVISKEEFIEFTQPIESNQ